MTLGKACTKHGIPESICVACRGAAEEHERIIALLYQQLAYYNKLLQTPKSRAFEANMQSRKKGIIESIKLIRMKDLEAEAVFYKNGVEGEN